MEYSIQYRDGMFEVKICGDAQPGRFKEALDELLAHGQWGEASRLLIDESELRGGSFTARDIQQLADLCAERKSGIGQARCAVLASSPLEFGLSRMWGALVENRLEIQNQIFKSREEAIAWLRA